MESTQKKTSMPVCEMAAMLGIKKTDSYWLIKKHLFDVIIVDKKMRIMVDSFEKWYAGQTHYHKVAGGDREEG